MWNRTRKGLGKEWDKETGQVRDESGRKDPREGWGGNGREEVGTRFASNMEERVGVSERWKSGSWKRVKTRCRPCGQRRCPVRGRNDSSGVLHDSS